MRKAWGGKRKRARDGAGRPTGKGPGKWKPQKKPAGQIGLYFDSDATAVPYRLGGPDLEVSFLFPFCVCVLGVCVCMCEFFGFFFPIVRVVICTAALHLTQLECSSM